MAGLDSGAAKALLQKTPITDSSSQEKVQMKKELGLLEGVAIILGIIFGSGNLTMFKYLYFLRWNKLNKHVLSRNFYISKRCPSGGWISRFFSVNMDSLWSFVNDWSFMLC